MLLIFSPKLGYFPLFSLAFLAQGNPEQIFQNLAVLFMRVKRQVKKNFFCLFIHNDKITKKSGGEGLMNQLANMLLFSNEYFLLF